jgi:Tol biopolymer transport system component
MFPFGRSSRLSILCVCLIFEAPAHLPAQEQFTLSQAMSAPFNSDLTAAPAGDAFAWVSNAEGRRNIWVAQPSSAGHGFVSRQLTSYAADDGQQIGELAWSPDARSIVYVRGGSADNPEQAAPNPAHLPAGAEQDVWIVSLAGGAPREVGKGNSPGFSPSGKTIAWYSDGRIWFQSPAAAIGSRLR